MRFELSAVFAWCAYLFGVVVVGQVLHGRWSASISTPRLNAWLSAYVGHFPAPWHLGCRCSLKYLTQVNVRPPTLVAWTNVAAAFPVSYTRQVMNALRTEFDLAGTPIRLLLRSTAMPKPSKKLSSKEKKQWTSVGSKQAAAVSRTAGKAYARPKGEGGKKSTAHERRTARANKTKAASVKGARTN
eukprot:GHVT01023621.1.p1 GENE.GHVT01023621.1~~GHVT01023621.1.p1  ORF type:complete len:186 (+),score=35.74 GHVT01023621.1:211-768(+)